jgi:two-component system sensor histidine kinase DegS
VASEANITAECQRDEIRVTISYNGKAFKLPWQLREFASQGTLGLTGMVERVQLVGGKLEVNSQEGRGTTIVVRVPTRLYAGTSS